MGGVRARMPERGAPQANRRLRSFPKRRGGRTGKCKSRPSRQLNTPHAPLCASAITATSTAIATAIAPTSSFATTFITYPSASSCPDPSWDSGAAGDIISRIRCARCVRSSPCKEGMDAATVSKEATKGQAQQLVYLRNASTCE
mmetsp:Transcript_5151/g.7956  ORF Transcript_5151/g.7956 Transcript_5151/m.7956 type:complete len:144 (-) Transcript_5151:163-594(-)